MLSVQDVPIGGGTTNGVLPEEWPWGPTLDNDISLGMKVECFLKYIPSKAFHLKDTQEVLRFFDDYLENHPVHILRLGQNNRLRVHITLDEASSFVIDGVISCSIKLPKGETDGRRYALVEVSASTTSSVQLKRMSCVEIWQPVFRESSFS